MIGFYCDLPMTWWSNNDAANDLCYYFADEKIKRGSGDYYEGKRRVMRGEALRATWQSKKAELAAGAFLYYFLRLPMVYPDFRVYPAEQKGWAPDLPYAPSEFPNVHVKSCNKHTADYVKDMSWTFQLANSEGGGGRDKLLDSDGTDVVVGVYADYPESATYRIMMVSAFAGVRHLLCPPKKPDLVGLKLCLDYLRVKQQLTYWDIKP